MKLVSLEAVKSHLNVDHDEDDTLIESYIDSASASVLLYLDGAIEFETNTAGDELLPDANGEPDAPFNVRAATLLLVQALYDGEDPANWDQNYLPRPVVSLLYPNRVPALG